MTYADFFAEWRGPLETGEAHTSGSTGQPKTILLHKKDMERSARRTVDFFGIDACSSLHSCISPDTIGGKMMALRSLMVGCRFSYETPSNRPELSPQAGSIFLDGKPAEECPSCFDLVSVVPSQMLHVTRYPERYRHVKRWLVGGSPIPASLAKAIAKEGLEVWESYGMTETCSHIALRRVGAVKKEESENIDAFRPLAGITLSLDSRGCLTIEGATAEKIVTNDIAALNPDGTFRILGRADNAIISGGRKIHPEELEYLIGEILNDHGIDFIGLMVSGESDEKWGARAILTIEGCDNIDKAEILAKLRSRLEGWMTPKEIRYGKIPRTSNGKIKRR